MPWTHRPYPPEFRAEAVRLARGSERSILALAVDLGSRPRRCATGCARPTATTAGGNPAT